MIRRTFSGMALCAAMLSLFPNAVQAEESKQPNILLITADDMSWDSVGIYGCPVANPTPNLDKLASQGMRFDYAYVQIAVCTPSNYAGPVFCQQI